MNKQSGPSNQIISLLKGGGAIRGIGEKFAANPVSGTGSMSVPIATSPGRGGFGPQLSLSYDSGAGNGPFGFGWSLSIPQITRKTDKGLPQYRDAEESDVFILSGAEDLVPGFEKDAYGEWVIKEGKHAIHDKPRTVDGVTYAVRRYRPRIEGLFARIERWTNQADAKDTFWRSITRDNVTTWYGRTANSRIADPSEPTHIFNWLICQSYDDKGNVIVYRYKEEDSESVDSTQAHERNRTPDTRKANRYLKRIYYGNCEPYLPALTETEWPEPPDPNPASDTPNYYFEVVFDYEDGHYTEDNPDTDGRIFARPVYSPPTGAKWSVRVDAFSTYRAGFEIRTYRLCQRVLMFHHFPTELDTPDCLVRSTDFTYSYENNPKDSRNPIYSFLDSVSQSGYRRRADGIYLKRSLPPLQFEYTKPEVQAEVREVDDRSLENLPYGLDGEKYQWVDLDGEGLSGILTEQAEGWFYKRNLSPVNLVRDNGREHAEASFAPIELVAKNPSSAVTSTGAQQLLDLAGDGQLDLVALRGPTPGFFERTHDEGWEPFKPFASLPNVEWNDPNLKFVDLTGDGHADVLITEEEVFLWYPSLAEAGFGPAERVPQDRDEEKGPRLVFADGEHSIHLADLSGDGLSDLVRIRNGEVCYWPNLGYGRFGAKVTMDRAPWFDHPDQFEPRRIQLADIDGSGTTDIIYLGRAGVDLYFNQSGNSWSNPRRLDVFPQTDNLSSVTAMDLLGNGTACLVWSSPLPGNARRPMRYLDLMGGNKPHLLMRTANNLGAETKVQYAPSTKFYVADKLAGKPWITKIPFPVHVVEKVTVTDKWRHMEFSSTYSYHHGYFDGIEREFRGFGRVDQVDIETYGDFAQGNAASPYVTDDKTLYQPPVKTVTWFHTGASLDRELILSHFADEYFPNWLIEAGFSIDPDYAFSERALPEPDLGNEDLNTAEWREALRACKGMTLRQEVYELDVDSFEAGRHKPMKLFTTAYHNCHIQRLQPREQNQHAVFLVAESEAITYHYELDMKDKLLRPDPRIAHALTLNINEYGQPLQTAAVGYPRVRPFREDTPTLPAGADTLIRQVQAEIHLSYTETRYTNDPTLDDHYRLPVACEVSTYELTGIRPDDEGDRTTSDPWDDVYFTLDELLSYRLSEKYQTEGTSIEIIPYHQLPDRTKPQKRVVEHVRMLFFDENLADPLTFGKQGRLGLPYETYTLALTEDLLQRVFGNKLTADVRTDLSNATISGYLSDAALAARFAGIDTTDQFWMRSGIAGFAGDAAQHFYLPESYTDSFNNVTTLKFDGRDLYIQSSTDARGNRIEVTQFDFRLLTPSEIKDPNDNYSTVAFDALGMPVASAVLGKNRTESGDNLTNLRTDLTVNEVDAFLIAACDVDIPRGWLENATARFVYDLGEKLESGKITYGHRPAGACGIMREKHVGQLNGGENRIQVAVEYSDGLGALLVKKAQAEPAPGDTKLRWIASGKTILNNKGKPVKQYEPYFSENEHRFDKDEAQRETGVTSVMYYDAAGRLIRTELPDGTFSRVEFSPWHVKTYDQNDTVLDSQWYQDCGAPDPAFPLAPGTSPDTRAAWLAAQHADTPALTILDSLGRDVISVAHNRVKDPNGPLTFGGEKNGDDHYLTYTKLDAEGKPLWIRDARGNLVMQYITPAKANNDPSDAMPSGCVPCYDIAGNLLFQHSMDGGDRWMLMDAAGKPMLAWDVNQRQLLDNSFVDEQRLYLTEYDQLHRPTLQWLSINNEDPKMVQRYGYQDAQPNDINNLNGQLVQRYDPGGRLETIRRDFKGNVCEIKRRLNNAPLELVIDWQGDPTTKLDNEAFVQITEYDALNRMTRLFNWHRGGGSRVGVYKPAYNERGLLKSEQLVTRARKVTRPDGSDDYDVVANVTSPRAFQGTRDLEASKEIRYNVKGQKEFLKLGNGTLTQYDYDARTFRLRQLRTTRLKSGQTEPAFPEFGSNLIDPRVLQQLHYTYDPVGNIAEIYDEAYEPVFFMNQQVEPRSRYTYDALYRLIEAEGREGFNPPHAPTQRERTPQKVGVFPLTDQTLRYYTQRYTYDAVGNILHMRHIATQGNWHRRYAYAPDSNRLLRTWEGHDDWNSSNARRKTEYHYDPHGNMRNLANVAPGQYLRWDHRDMITSLDLVGGGWAYYQYDSGKQRTRKRLVRSSGRVEERIYFGGFELYRRYTASSNSPVEEIESHHLFEGEQRVLLVDDMIKTNRRHADYRPFKTEPILRYQYSNHLGSACLELDEHSEIISYEEYHPYGTSAYRAVKSGIEAPPKRYRYTGMERDEESGVSYHGARYYAPWIGRWNSTDPAGLVDGPNLYSCMRDNPINLSDTSGLQTENQTQAKEAVLASYIRLAQSAQRPLMSYAIRADTRVYWKYHGVKGGERVSFVADHIRKQPAVDKVFRESTSKVPYDTTTGKVKFKTATDLGGPTTDPSQLSYRRHDLIIKSKAAHGAATTMEVSNFESFETQGKQNQMEKTGESIGRKMYVGDPKRGYLAHQADIPQDAIVPKGGKAAPGWNDPATGLKIEPIAPEAVPPRLFENTPPAPKSVGGSLARQGTGVLKGTAAAAAPAMLLLQATQNTPEMPLGTSTGAAADYDLDALDSLLGTRTTMPASVAYRQWKDSEQKADAGALAYASRVAQEKENAEIAAKLSEELAKRQRIGISGGVQYP